MEFKKKLQARLYIAVSYIVIGLLLIAADALNHFENQFFFSFGITLIVMGILRLLRHRKITRDLDYGFWDATTFGDGYIVQLGNNIRKEFATIAMVDREGNITKTLTYESDDAMYRVNDMIEFNGKIYLSAYAVPNLAEDENSYGGRDEIAPILGQVFESKDWDIPSEELTPMVRQRYSAVLLVCDPDAGAPQEFYTVKGSLGGKLAVSDEGELLWDVESITRTFFSLGTSSFTIGGTCYVFRYTFDDAGRWIGLAKTNEITDFRR